MGKTTVSNWKVGIDKGKYGPMGEDLFAEMCMRKNGVSAMEAFDITKDGACEAKRPGNEKKNKKWKPDCSTWDTPAIHPFKKPADFIKCMEEAEEAPCKEGSLSASRSFQECSCNLVGVTKRT